MPWSKGRSINPLTKISSLELSSRINRFMRADYASLTDNEIRRRISRMSSGYVSLPCYVGKYGAYRARINEGGEFFKFANQLWYPPAEVAQGGRFNSVGEPKFYASGCPSTAILEVRPKVGDFVTVLFAAAKNGGWWEVSHVGSQKLIGRRSAKFPTLRDNEQLIAHLKRIGIEKKWHRIDATLSKIAGMPINEHNAVWLYRLTRPMGVMLNGLTPDGLVYPSIAAYSKEMNFCLTTECADRTLFPAAAWVLEIVGWKDKLAGFPYSPVGYYEYRIRARSGDIPESGAITWEETPPDTSISEMIDIIDKYVIPLRNPFREQLASMRPGMPARLSRKKNGLLP